MNLFELNLGIAQFAEADGRLQRIRLQSEGAAKRRSGGMYQINIYIEKLVIKAFFLLAAIAFLGETLAHALVN